MGLLNQFELIGLIEYTGYSSKQGGHINLKTLITALLAVSTISITAYAQGGGEYTVKAVKGEYVIVAEKPYKMLTVCEGIKPEDKVSFSESPITCSQATLVNLLTLSECEVECITNTGTPYEPPPLPETMTK